MPHSLTNGFGTLCRNMMLKFCHWKLLHAGHLCLRDRVRVGGAQVEDLSLGVKLHCNVALAYRAFQKIMHLMKRRRMPIDHGVTMMSSLRTQILRSWWHTVIRSGGHDDMTCIFWPWKRWYWQPKIISNHSSDKNPSASFDNSCWAQGL